MRPNRFEDSSEDIFAETRMSFGDHIEELRWRMWRALAGFAVIMALVFVLDSVGYATGTPLGVAKPVMDVIAAPVEAELQKFYDRRAEKLARDIQEGRTLAPVADQAKQVELEVEVNGLARVLGLAPPDRNGEEHYVTLPVRISPKTWAVALQEAQRRLGQRPALKAMSVSEAMMVYFEVALGCGVVLGSPWILWQMWLFVAAGMYPQEKRYVHRYLPFSLGLFLAGVLLCEFVVMPKAVEALLWFNEWLNFEPELRLSEWLSFAVLMPLVFGLAFQTPLVMLFLERLGVVPLDTYRNQRRLAWFGMAIFAALITPSIEVFSMLLLWVPMSLLYELGILLCRASGRSPAVAREAVDV